MVNGSIRFARVGASMLVMVLIFVFIFLLALGAAAEWEAGPGRTAPTAVPGDWECLAGAECHVLLQPGSSVYVLTADGRIRVDMYGHNSGLVSNQPNYSKE